MVEDYMGQVLPAGCQSCDGGGGVVEEARNSSVIMVSTTLVLIFLHCQHRCSQQI